ncbi:DUF4389 domain-containing protein [Streptomyces sp. NPDC097619]|uniref:DUF4389 domain-containing protein n=1 Tax=Streptomyces sp. NPDC097619 TaxID=3157228 RepID=UPI0033334F27
MSTGWEARTSGADGGPEPEALPELDVPPPGRQRRWTVLLRGLLLIPQFVVTAVLGFAAFFVTVAGWFAALFTGRMPAGLGGFLSDYLAYATRVTASAMLLVDRYPPFSFEARGYPVRVSLPPPGPLNRWAVLFRLVLMIPAVVVASLLQSGWFVLAWVFWLIALVLGRLPETVFGAVAAVARYRMRLMAYVMMLGSAYPKGLFGEDPGSRPVPVAATGTGAGGGAGPAAGVVSGPDPTKGAGAETGDGYGAADGYRAGAGAGVDGPSGTRPLVLGTGSKVLVVLFLLLGLLGGGASGTAGTTSDDAGAGPGTSFRAR